MKQAIPLLFAAFIDSFRPRMLMLTLIAVALACVFWFVVIWVSLDPLIQGAMWLLSLVGVDFSAQVDNSEWASLSWIKVVLIPLAVFGLLWPLVATSAVLLAGLYVTPPVVRYLSDKEFKGIQKKGEFSLFASAWITLKAVAFFLIAWILTLPLWLIPGLAFVLPIVLTAYLLMQVMRFDSLSAHASALEMEEIKKRDSGSAWVIGLVCAFLSFIPPVLLIMPVMSALAFTRHYMANLVAVRKSKAADAQGVQFNAVQSL